MAKRMKDVTAPRGGRDVLVIEVDQLRLARGHPAALGRGGAHRSARRPARARSKQELRRQLADGSAGRRGRCR
jgi:hypothetical protein